MFNREKLRFDILVVMLGIIITHTVRPTHFLCVCVCVWHSRNKSESSRRRGCHSTWHNNIKTPLAGSSKKAGIKVARCLLPVEQKQQQEKEGEKERVSEREGAVGGARSCCTVVLPGALPRRCHCGRAANYFASHTHTHTCNTH